MAAIRNKLFYKYGHDCELASTRDELPMYRSGGNLLEQIKNTLQRSIMTSDDNIDSLKYLKSQKNVERERLRHLPYKMMIHPFSDSRQTWDTIMVCVLLLAYIIIPVDIATSNFPLQNSITDNTAWKLLRFTLDLIMCGDVIINFLTGYWDPQRSRIIMQPKKVVVRYLCTFFIADFAGALPTHSDFLFYIRNKTTRSIMSNLPILKAFRFFYFLRSCKKLSEARQVDFLQYHLALAMYCYILYFHVLTCFNILLIGVNAPESEKRLILGTRPKFVWIIGNRTFDFYATYARVVRSTVYIAMFGKTSTSLQTYTPITVYIIMLAVSKLVTLFLISEFMEIVISSRSSSRKYLEMVRELTEYMRHKQLPVALQNRLLEYYEFKFQKSYFRESEILNVISGQLKQDLLMHSCRKLVEHVGFFQNLPTPLILRIVSALTIEVYMVNDVIVKIGTPGICMYFIASGCVAIYTRNGYEVSHLEDGEYFGEYSLLKQQEPREHSVIAVEICELYRLEYSDFVKVIMSYPDLIEKITKHALERIEATEFTAARYDRRKRRR